MQLGGGHANTHYHTHTGADTYANVDTHTNRYAPTCHHFDCNCVLHLYADAYAHYRYANKRTHCYALHLAHRHSRQPRL